MCNDDTAAARSRSMLELWLRPANGAEHEVIATLAGTLNPPALGRLESMVERTVSQAVAEGQWDQLTRELEDMDQDVRRRARTVKS